MGQERNITICLGSSCFSRGNKEILDIIRNYLKQHNLESAVFFSGELCTGLCEDGPVLKVDDAVFTGVTTENVYEILNRYFVQE